jgi:hypothetical protein
MKTLSIALFCALSFGSAIAQDAAAQAQSPAAQVAPGTAAQMPHEIEIALQKYVSAYERRSAQELLAIWPDLQNQKKEFGKIKQHFDDGSISNEHLSLHPLATQVLKDDAIVQCERSEKFAKTGSTPTGGDLIMNSSPAQSPPPSQSTKDVKKTDKVWVKLHKNGDDWVIVTVSPKQLSF